MAFASAGGIFRQAGAACLLALVLAGAAQAEDGRCSKGEATAMPDLKALPSLARKIGDGTAIRIVALGSSSTEGTPDIAKDAIFPAVMQRELSRELLTPVEVINKGKGGETIPRMVERMERDVFALKPDVVVWQLGVNDVLQMDGVERPIALMREALESFRKHDVPVVLVDLQTAPMVDNDKDTPVMQAAISEAGRRSGVLHFHRKALMNRLVETQTVAMPELLSKDGLHMTTLAHFCTGKLLARQIARAGLMRRAEAP
jgi:acyl-CoA thioesterase I